MFTVLMRFPVHMPVRTPMYGLPLSQSDQRIRSIFLVLLVSVDSINFQIKHTLVLITVKRSNYDHFQWLECVHFLQIQA